MHALSDEDEEPLARREGLRASVSRVRDLRGGKEEAGKRVSSNGLDGDRDCVRVRGVRVSCERVCVYVWGREKKCQISQGGPNKPPIKDLAKNCG